MAGWRPLGGVSGLPASLSCEIDWRGEPVTVLGTSRRSPHQSLLRLAENLLALTWLHPPPSEWHRAEVFTFGLSFGKPCQPWDPGGGPAHLRQVCHPATRVVMRFSVLSIQQRGHLASWPLAHTQALATVFHVLGTFLGVLTIEQTQ